MAKIKNFITVLMLLFVAGTVVYLFIGKKSTNPPVTEHADSVSVGNMPGHRVIVYYFHGNVRCETCHKIETYSSEAVRTAFADELKSGKLKWSVVNVDETENEHFTIDYSLSSRAIVLSDVVDGKQKQWKNLDKIWDLVGDKAKFIAYVQDETKAYLKE